MSKYHKIQDMIHKLREDNMKNYLTEEEFDKRVNDILEMLEN